MPLPGAKKPKSASSNRSSTGLRGLADFRQNGPNLIASVCATGEPAVFGTGKVPQIRMRSAALNPDEVSFIPDDARFTFVEAKSNFSQIRAAIMFGEPFVVTSMRNRVILDRHPECPHEIVDGVRLRWKKKAVENAVSVTRKHAKLASQTSLRIEQILEAFLNQQEAVANEIVKSLKDISANQGGLSSSDRNKLAQISKKVDTLWFRAGARKDNDGRRSANETDLEIY